MEFDGRSVRNLAEPDVEILALSCLEEQNVVAVVQLGEFVEFVKLRLGVELGILPAVGEHRGDIVKKVTMTIRRAPVRDRCTRVFIMEQGILPESDTSGRENQDSLLVLLNAIARHLDLGGLCLGDGFVNGRHFEYEEKIATCKMWL